MVDNLDYWVAILLFIKIYSQLSMSIDDKKCKDDEYHIYYMPEYHNHIEQQNKYNMNQPQKQQHNAMGNGIHHPPYQNAIDQEHEQTKEQHPDANKIQHNQQAILSKFNGPGIRNQNMQEAYVDVEKVLGKKEGDQIVYGIPKEVSIPWPKFKTLVSSSEADTIIPCTFIVKKQQPKQIPNHQGSRNREDSNIRKNTEQSMLDSKVSVQREEMERSKIMTGVLIDKIALLQKTVRQLQEERNIYKQRLRQNPNIASKPESYQSTPNSPTKMGMIRKNNNNEHYKASNNDNFKTVADTNQTSSKNFRVRPVNPNQNESSNVRSVSSLNRLHSNIISLVVMQSKEESSIKSELLLLKQKLALIEQQQKIDKEKQQLLQQKNRLNEEKNSQNNSKNKIHLNYVEQRVHELTNSRKSNLSVKSNHSIKSNHSLKSNKSNGSRMSQGHKFSRKKQSESQNQKQKEWKKQIEIQKQKMLEKEMEIRKKMEDYEREKQRRDIEKVSPQRRNIQGKIKRGNSSMNSSMQDSFQSRDNDDINPTPKGFVRSDPRGVHSAVPQNAYSEMDQQNSNIFLRQESIERKKIQRVDSSAIFRKNPGPALQRGQSAQEYIHQFGTLQFNPQKEKFIVSDSKDSQMNERDQNTNQNYQKAKDYRERMFTFQIPDLTPSPTTQSSSQELIEIGKITFQKLGSEITENTAITVKKYKNCVYFSISKEQNILWNYQGKFYFGGWKILSDGEEGKSGQGLEYVPGKYRFKGFFVQGKKSGYGVMITESGVIYQGQWEDGLKHGTGQQKSEDGLVYDGEWRVGKKNGFGRIYNRDRLQFEGIFEKGLKHGHGKEFFENGDYYQGQYRENKFEGNGTYLWSTGAQYKGQFKNGQRDGQGIWKADKNSGDYYEGEYEKDLKNGYGVYHWGNGSVYEGNFKDDLKHGEGTITYQNGKVAHLLWDKGAVQKKMEMSTRFRTPDKKLVQKNHSITPQRGVGLAQRGGGLGNRNFGAARSAQNLQSAKSTNTIAERSLPKGISTSKGFHPKKPIETRVNGQDFIKLKIGDELKELKKSIPSNFSKSKKQQYTRGMPKDTPYRGVQMSANPNMYL